MVSLIMTREVLLTLLRRHSSRVSVSPTLQTRK